MLHRTSAEAEALLAWYDRARRKLPWRAEPGEPVDPYRVWLSEIMLQQTTVKAVAPYFADFLARWPNVVALAAAPVDEVMKAWAGLGYYSRARNLHACALVVARDLGGRFPEMEDALSALPGIGAYTAAAIAAIAFGRPAAVVDGNIERVTTRLARIATPLPAAKADVRKHISALVPADRPGDFAQALMDLGATICTPRDPACALCPLDRFCAARKVGDQTAFPVKAAKAERPPRFGIAFVARRADGALLVETRPPRGLLGGMTGFPGTTWGAKPDAGAVAAARPLPIAFAAMPGIVTHVFTHFTLEVTVHLGEAPLDTLAPAGLRWIAGAETDGEALPQVFRKVLAHATGKTVQRGPARRLNKA